MPTVSDQRLCSSRRLQCCIGYLTSVPIQPRSPRQIQYSEKEGRRLLYRRLIFLFPHHPLRPFPLTLFSPIMSLLSPLRPARGSRERCKLFCRGLGQCFGRKSNLTHLAPRKGICWQAFGFFCVLSLYTFWHSVSDVGVDCSVAGDRLRPAAT